MNFFLSVYGMQQVADDFLSAVECSYETDWANIIFSSDLRSFISHITY